MFIWDNELDANTRPMMNVSNSIEQFVSGKVDNAVESQSTLNCKCVNFMIDEHKIWKRENKCEMAHLDACN